MSKERARRREEREAVAAAERAARERAQARRRRWGRVRTVLVAPLHRGDRRESPLQRRRGRQNGVLAASLLASHAALWLLTPSWVIRIGALVLTALAWPLLVVLLFDRRASS